MRIISKLVVVTLPSTVHMYTGYSTVPVTNSTVGPYTDGEEVSLQCITAGQRWKWVLRNKLLTPKVYYLPPPLSKHWENNNSPSNIYFKGKSFRG